MYFGASFSRYGFDFRPLFIEYFSRTAVNNFRSSLSEANNLFQQLLQSYTFDQSATASTVETQANPFSPPMILVNYTPIAVYCNSLLSAFNDLRLCCPLSTVATVKKYLTDSIIFTRDILCNYYHSEKLTLTITESQHFLEFLDILIRIFYPFLSSCLQALYPDNQLARELGVSVLEISEKLKLNRLEIDQVIGPIQIIIDSMTPKKVNTAFDTDNIEPARPVVDEPTVDTPSSVEE